MPIRPANIASLIASTGLSLVMAATVLTASSSAAVPILEPAAAIQTASVRPQTQLWSMAAVQDLVAEASAAEQEGLSPDAYDIPGLVRAAAAGPSDQVDQFATRVAMAVARDYARGRTPDPSRFDWHIEPEPAALGRLSAELDAAVRTQRLRTWLRSLLPSDSRYAALRTAYNATPVTDTVMRDRLKANLERWRWMPRSLGADHIYVNVPSYTLSVVDDGEQVSTYTVVVGKPSTPTPQIAVSARSVVVNPWWNVPPSIASKMRGAGKGFVHAPGGGIRQKPGPGNALGKVKIDMPNPHAIYLHDTPSKSLFAQQSRAFSHGCIRVKDIDKLATELVELDRGDERGVRTALSGSATRTLPLQQSRPVYLVYFTADAGPDGTIISYEDPYGRDKKVLDMLDKTTRTAAAKVLSPAGKVELAAR